MFLEIAMGVSAASSILQGIGGKKGAKYIANAERDIARMQYEYNKKEVDRAFKQNLEDLMKDYANQELKLNEEAKTLLANININTGKKNVDRDSYSKDVKNKAINEITDNMTAMVVNKINSIGDLGRGKAAQQYQVDRNYGSALSKINQAQIEANRKANFSIINGIATLGGLGIESYLKNKPIGTTETNITDTVAWPSYPTYEDGYFDNFARNFSEFGYKRG